MGVRYWLNDINEPLYTRTAHNYVSNFGVRGALRQLTTPEPSIRLGIRPLFSVHLIMFICRNSLRLDSHTLLQVLV